MIIFLGGPDSYRRQQKVKELTTFYRQKHPNFDFKKFDLSENQEDYLALKDFLAQQSLFDNFKMGLVNGIFEVEPKNIKPILKDQLAKENSILLISEEKKPTKEFDFLLQKPVYYQEFKKLKAKELAFFIRKEAEKRNLKFEPKAKEYLIRWQEYTNTDSWALVNELDKIALAGFPQPVSAGHLESLIPFSYREKIFDLAGILAGRNSLKKKIVALEQLLIQKEPAAYAFNLLSYGAPVNLLLKLADYDVSVKSGGLDYEEVLLDLALANN
jgi:DNA polymerase III delta subunit